MYLKKLKIIKNEKKKRQGADGEELSVARAVMSELTKNKTAVVST
jgi:hypothetical protein